MRSSYRIAISPVYRNSPPHGRKTPTTSTSSAWCRILEFYNIRESQIYHHASPCWELSLGSPPSRPSAGLPPLKRGQKSAQGRRSQHGFDLLDIFRDRGIVDDHAEIAAATVGAEQGAEASTLVELGLGNLAGVLIGGVAATIAYDVATRKNRVQLGLA